MKRAIYLLSRLAFALGAMCAAILFWGFFIEVPYLSYTNLPFPPTVKRVLPGEIVPLTVRRCNSKAIKQTYAVSREMRPADVSRPVLLLTMQAAPIDPGCTEGISRLHIVPLDAAPGVYSIHGLGFAQGTLRTFAVPWFSGPFEVVLP